MYTSTKEIAVSETTELVVIERASALEVFTSPTKIDELLQDIERQARSFVPDLSTGTSRKAIASMANKVARSKTYIDAIGKDVVADLKKLPAQIDEQRRLVRERLDLLKDEVRKPLTDWEVEQERFAAEKAAEEERLRIATEEKAAAEAMAIRVRDDHELALYMNKDIDRERAEKAAELERQRIAHEEEIKRQAAEQARIDAEENIKREREESAQREAALKLKAEQEEQAKIEVQQAAEREKKEAAEKVEREKKEAQERAEREKQEAIAEEQRKQQEAEQRRVAEEKRLKDEADKRAADVAHRKTIGTAVVNALTEHAGLTREQAIETLKALMDNKIPHTSIQY
jgi:colicin import membrane protein